MLYIALGILGATVMPHNLYLHSSIIQTRRFGDTPAELQDAIRAAYTDSTVALMLALFVNAAILILAAAAFYRTGHHEIGDIQSAYKLLTPLLGAQPGDAAVRHRAAGLGAELHADGTMAGQIILEGFTHFQIRRLAAADDLAAAGHRAGALRRRPVRDGGHGQAADLQPGGALAAALVRGDPAGPVHRRPAEDGPFRERAGHEDRSAGRWQPLIFGLNAYLVFATFFPHLVPGAAHSG